MAKITVSLLRELLAAVDAEQITFGRMAEILNERAAQPEDYQWAVGNVRCDLCGHEWIAVRPASCDELECPHCEVVGGFSTFD